MNGRACITVIEAEVQQAMYKEVVGACSLPIASISIKAVAVGSMAHNGPPPAVITVACPVPDATGKVIS